MDPFLEVLAALLLGQDDVRVTGSGLAQDLITAEAGHQGDQVCPIAAGVLELCAVFFV